MRFSVYPVDLSMPAQPPTYFFNRLALAVLAFFLASGQTATAEPIITEFMASNKTTLADDDGDFSDWIEINNPDPTPINLNGWYLTDSASDKNKWQFPAVTIPAGGYLVVFASGKNRRNATRTLHTNFSLNDKGDYLGLVKPDGITVVSQFAPKYPDQSEDISYGVAQTSPGTPAAVGFFRKATPGAVNGGPSSLMLVETVTLSRAPGPFTSTFTLTLTGASAGQRIRYILAPPSAAGATIPEPTATSTLYTAPISVSSNVIVRTAVFSANDSLSGRTAMAQFVKLGANLTAFTTKLPVIVLDSHGLGELGKDGIDHSSWIYTYEPAATVFSSVPKLASPSTMTVRGNFSSNFLKSSFSLTLLDSLNDVRYRS